ncbi:MAG: PhzF family phenazine biosynthesis protein [candidate division Zixibacteria bacterium]|nr:PhzF family phenazine biosynthesis protein [candidate division Zixibacteria bacterium]
MGQKLYQVDSFSTTAFAGNPAGVCVMKAAAPEEWMQNIAAEMNLSETAFLYPDETGYSLRWFTPRVEVELCGHATLASAHILWETGEVDPDDEISFFTLSGELIADREGEFIRLDFPASAPSEVAAPDGLFEALGVDPLYVGTTRFDYLIEVASDKIVRGLTPDFGAIAKTTARGVMVTSRSSDSRYDFISRFFAPAVGIDEDPVTGSAHCALAPYWRDKIDRDELSAFQASKRGGELRLRVIGDRVHLLGRAVTVFDVSVR